MRSHVSLSLLALSSVLLTVYSAHLHRHVTYDHHHHHRIREAAEPLEAQLTADLPALTSFPKTLLAFLTNLLDRIQHLESFLNVSGFWKGSTTELSNSNDPSGDGKLGNKITQPSLVVENTPSTSTIPNQIQSNANNPTQAETVTGAALSSEQPAAETSCDSTARKPTTYFPGLQSLALNSWNISTLYESATSQTRSNTPGSFSPAHFTYTAHSNFSPANTTYTAPSSFSPAHVTYTAANSDLIESTISIHTTRTTTSTRTITRTVSSVRRTTELLPISTSDLEIASDVLSTLSSAPISEVTQLPSSAETEARNTPTGSSSALYPPFDYLSSSNVAVYYGQTPPTSANSLLKLCSNPNTSIINLAFISTFFGPNGYPTTAFGPACTGPSPLQQQLAPGLQNCTLLGEQIKTCQQVYNKKILVSLGGYIAQSAFQSDSQAVAFANRIWNLFGAGAGTAQGRERELRPFGDAVVDGFDIDNENHNPTSYAAFALALRTLYASPNKLTPPNNIHRRYFLSTTPQCPRPDASIPLAAMRASDFVFVQFYNNQGCQISDAGFLDSVKAWSGDLQGGTSFNGQPPKLFIGVGAWPGAGSGYVDATTLKSKVKAVRGLGLSNLGGVMMWDGVEGMANKDAEGVGYVRRAKEALLY